MSRPWCQRGMFLLAACGCACSAHAQLSTSLAPDMGQGSIPTYAGGTQQNGLDSTFEPSTGLDATDPKTGISDPFESYLETSELSSLFDPSVSVPAVGGYYAAFVSPLSDAAATVRLVNQFGLGQRSLEFASGVMAFGMRAADSSRNSQSAAAFRPPSAGSGMPGFGRGILSSAPGEAAALSSGQAPGVAQSQSSELVSVPVSSSSASASSLMQQVPQPSDSSQGAAWSSGQAGPQVSEGMPGDMPTPLQQVSLDALAGTALGSEFEHDDGLPPMPQTDIRAALSLAAPTGLSNGSGFQDSTQGTASFASPERSALEARLSTFVSSPLTTFSDSSLFAVHPYLVPNLHAAAPVRTQDSFAAFERRQRRARSLERNLYGSPRDTDETVGEDRQADRQEFRAIQNGRHPLRDTFEEPDPLGAARWALSQDLSGTGR